MKFNKTKLLCSLLMLTCVFSLTACNGEKEMLSYDEKEVASQCESIYGEISQEFTDEDYAVITSYNDYQLEDVSDNFYKEYGIHIDGSTIITAMDSYRNATVEMGNITPNGNIDFDAKEDELIVTYYLNGSSHDGSLEVIYDKNLTVTSVTTNIQYSFEELMTKAGVNTAIGMGTVFVMLIVIMFIITLLGFVPKLFEKKPKEEPKKDGVDKAIEGIVAREEAAEEEDDTELVAVIAAAIAAYEGTSADGFVVRSIKRIK